MTTANNVERVSCRCPYCESAVIALWETGAGILSDPSYVLVADSLFHAKCWDRVVAEDVSE